MAGLPQIDSLMGNASAPRAERRGKGLSFSPLIIMLLLVAAALICYGLVVCWSATSASTAHSFTRQLQGVAIGLVAMVVIWHIDYRRFTNLSTFFLVVSIVLILLPHIPGLGTDAGMGAKSWIRVGMQIQPGEFAKVTIILFGASMVARYGGKLDDLREYLKCVVLMLLPFLCIMTQPDLGTGLVYLFIAATILVMGGARVRYLLVTLALGIAAIAAIFAIDEVIKNSTGDYKLLKTYQRNRLLVFLDPESGTSDISYNLSQAMIAIGSGGLFGKGFMNGTQAAYGYVPESETDFVFCVLAEEFGFFGAIVLLVLYILLILVCVRIARSSDDLFGMLICMGVVGMWLFQILENIGMTCGLMPITGIPLPFVSYGSSFMLVNFMMLGMICSVCSHKSALGKRGVYATPR